MARWSHSAPLAYLTLLALQLRRLWNVWHFRDMPNGDTASYYREAWLWFSQHKGNIAWSPLYTIFYGWMLHITRDVYAATTLHRILIVMSAAMLVLAVLRQLLPAGVAWIIAAWWVILPINFNTLYEVHLFALLPIALAWLIALGAGDRGLSKGSAALAARAIVLGIFVLTTFLLRNEYLIASGVFALICLVIEFRISKTIQPGRWTIWLSGTIAIYLAVLLGCAGVIYGFYRHSEIRYPQLADVLREKHTLNMAQVYAYGYMQRHPDWGKDPWSPADAGALCQEDFHVAMPTFWQMLRNNPRALGEHVCWNIRLVPSGWQILLLNTSSGSVDPDYAPQALGLSWPMYASLLLIALLVAGAALGWVERKRWRAWFAGRGLGWLTMLAAIGVCPAVVITQRPRPSYFFAFGLFCMAVIGTAGWILVRRFYPRRYEGIILLPIMLLGWRIAPTYYLPATRPVHDEYERLAPLSELISKNTTRGLAGDWPFEMQCYVGNGKGAEYTFNDVLGDYRGQLPLAEYLIRKQITFAYLDSAEIDKLESLAPGDFERFLSTTQANGYRLTASGPDRDTAAKRWGEWYFFTLEAPGGPENP